MRGRGLRKVMTLALPLGIMVLCVFAWMDAGRAPVRDMTVAIPVPELPK